jgi:hypothetical protein
MLACDQTVQCFDCLCVWCGDVYDDQTFLTAHPTPWELLEDAATSQLDYGALANAVAGDLKIDDENEDSRHECLGSTCAICVELREMYEDPFKPE